MAKSHTETHTHLATLECLQRRDASTFKNKRRQKTFSTSITTEFDPISNHTPDKTDLHDGEVPVHADAGQEEDAAVHVDEVAEDVQVGAGETRPSAVIEQDTSRQGEVHQEVGHCQVDGVDDGGGLLLGAEAENIKCNCVEDHAHLWDRRNQAE